MEKYVVDVTRLVLFVIISRVDFSYDMILMYDEMPLTEHIVVQNKLVVIDEFFVYHYDCLQ